VKIATKLHGWMNLDSIWVPNQQSLQKYLLFIKRWSFIHSLTSAKYCIPSWFVYHYHFESQNRLKLSLTDFISIPLHLHMGFLSPLYLIVPCIQVTVVIRFSIVVPIRLNVNPLSRSEFYFRDALEKGFQF